MIKIRISDLRIVYMRNRFFFFFFLLLLPGIFCCNGCGGSKLDVYEIGLDPLWYPLDFKNKDNNVLGFSTELLRLISKEEKITFSLLYTNWDSLLSGLNAGNYKAILSSLHPYNFNLQNYDFSELYLPIGPVLVLPVSSPYQSLADIKGKQVAALTGSSSILLLESYPNIMISFCNSISDIINQLESGQAVAALLPVLTARAYTTGSFYNRFKIASTPLNDEGLRLITKKGSSPKLLKQFNTGLEKLKKDGRYDTLLTEWRLQGPAS